MDKKMKIHSCEINKLAIVSHNSDFSDRNEALKMIQEYFGEENTIPVSNFAQLQLTSLCKDLARIYGVPHEVVNSYTTKMKSEAMAVARKTPGFDAATWEFTIESAQRDSPSYNEFMKEMEQFPEFKSALEVLYKQQRTCFTDKTEILTDSGYKQYKDIKLGKDKIAYLDQFGQIQYNENYKLIDQGVKSTFILKLDNGTILELTGDHPVMTVNGYKTVETLTDEDQIVSI